MVRDVEFESFVLWLWPKYQQSDEAGAVSRHVRARAFPAHVFSDPVALQADLNNNISFASESAPDHRIPLQGNVGFVPSLANCASALAAAPIDQLSWADFATLHTSILHFGPDCSMTQFNTALAQFRAS
jgi:hypothetical protein